MSPRQLIGIATIAGLMSFGPVALAQNAGKAAPAPKPAPAKPAAAPAAPAAPAAEQDAKPMGEMQTYYVALLRRGPKFVADGQPGAAVMSKQHQAYLTQLANLGVIALVGGCGDQADATDPAVGLCVLAVPSKEQALKIIGQDPAVAAEHLRAEVMSWVGPKGLSMKSSPAAAGAEGAPAAADAAKPGAVAPGRKQPTPSGNASSGDGAAPKSPAPAPKSAAPGAGAAAPKAAQQPAPKAAQPKPKG